MLEQGQKLPHGLHEEGQGHGGRQEHEEGQGHGGRQEHEEGQRHGGENMQQEHGLGGCGGQHGQK